MTEALTFIPPEMNPWSLQLITPTPSEFGAYELIACEQASIETHHQVEVIDEDGQPMRGVVVIFGFDSGPSINMPTRRSYWPDAPSVLRGNAQRTNAAGYAQHTFGQGGENVWIWDRNKEGDLLYPSAIVKNCSWQRTPVARFEHTGVALSFQLRRVGFISQAERMANLEAWVTTFTGQLTSIEARIQALEANTPPGVSKGQKSGK